MHKEFFKYAQIDIINNTIKLNLMYYDTLEPYDENSLYFENIWVEKISNDEYKLYSDKNAEIPFEYYVKANIVMKQIEK